MTLETLVTLLDYGSVLIFALTGALVASRAQLDLVGFVFMASLTAVGGGTLRDLILNRDAVFWVASPSYVVTATLAAILVFWTAHLFESRYKWLVWLDAVALSVAVAAGVGVAVEDDFGLREDRRHVLAPLSSFAGWHAREESNPRLRFWRPLGTLWQLA